MGRESNEPTELRKEIRYRLSAPAMFSWGVARRGQFQGEGTTRDISVQGAFIWTTTSPPAGSAICVDLLLPPLSGLWPTMRITGMARVVRVDSTPRGEGANGFAVATGEFHHWGLASLPGKSKTGLVEKEGAAIKVDRN